MHLSQYIEHLIARGRYVFTSQEAKEALNVSLVAMRAALRRLKIKGIIAEPTRGFHVIVPPEYRVLGCLPPDQFIPELMKYLKLPYYVGLLSAAEFYGAAHQKPQWYQVVTTHNRSDISCGRTKITFIARKDTQDVPVREFNTRTGIMRVSTPEVIAMDLVTYPHRAISIDHVLTVLIELSESMRANELRKLAQKSKEIPWMQRLGYLFDCAGATQLSNVLEKILIGRKTRIRPLLSPIKAKVAEHNKKWNILVNVKPEADL